MQNQKKILLASHGSEGARAAERAVLALAQNGTVHQLVVVPDLWQGMTGDDWLNNGVTRDRFTDYLETTLEKEVMETIHQTRDMMQGAGIAYSFEIRTGKPEQVLLDMANGGDYDLVVIGSPRPKGKGGLRSRMKLEPLANGLSVALMIVPYPDE